MFPSKMESLISLRRGNSSESKANEKPFSCNSKPGIVTIMDSNIVGLTCTEKSGKYN